MVKVVFIEPAGGEVELDAQDGWSAMQVAMSKGVDGIEAECGGSCACATCHCYVEGEAAARLPAPLDGELAMLENVAAERRPNSRLSCQIKLTPDVAGLVLRVAEVQS
jgi:2Fe-2S ferredoxin